MSQARDFEESLAKGCLISCAILAALIGGALVSLLCGVFCAIIAGLAIGLTYPLFGAIFIPACEQLRQWAYPEETLEAWSRNERIWLGAFWPVTTLCLLVVYLFLGMIHRQY
jgi:hypothetical protein